MRDYDLIISARYYLGPKNDLGHHESEDDHCCFAWRDPALFEECDGKIHIFWAEKSVECGRIQTVIGHCVVEQVMANAAVRLLQPIRLSNEENITQAEVPQIIYDQAKQRYVLLCSTTGKDKTRVTVGEDNLSVNFYTAETLYGPFELCRTVLAQEDQRYPGALVQHANGCLSVAAPFNRSSSPDKIQTLPPLTRLVIDEY